MFDHVEYFQGQMKYIIISQTKNISCAVGIVDAEINVPLLRTHSYRRFSFVKPWVGQNVAMHMLYLLPGVLPF